MLGDAKVGSEKDLIDDVSVTVGEFSSIAKSLNLICFSLIIFIR